MTTAWRNSNDEQQTETRIMITHRTTSRCGGLARALHAAAFGLPWSFVIRHSSLPILMLTTSLTVLATADDQHCDACRSADRHAIAGWPQCVAPWAKPSFGGHEYGYYVGGGAAWHGDGRCPHEGTWGWDYHGRLFQKRIWLGWHHGRKDQGGTGAYRTDGPPLWHH
jgi:hypothetical protein